MSLSVKEILNIGRRQLEESGIADAAIDCKLLYCYLMNISSTQLILEYQKVLPDSLCDEYFSLLDRRSSGVPLQYITGSQEFMGLDFIVNEHVLIPRQDTETMVEDAISVIRENQLRGQEMPIKKKREYEVLDLCCGSGAIGLSPAACFALATSKEQSIRRRMSVLIWGSRASISFLTSSNSVSYTHLSVCPLPYQGPSYQSGLVSRSYP